MPGPPPSPVTQQRLARIRGASSPDRAQVGPIRRDRDRRAADPSRSAASDRRRPSTRSSRAIGRWRRSGRQQLAEERARRRRAGRRSARRRSTIATRSRRAFAWASRSRAARNAGPLRWVAGPCPGRPRRRRRPSASAGLGWSAARRTRSSGSAPGASRPWSSSPWVNSKGARRSAPGIGVVELGRERPQPAGRRAARRGASGSRRRRARVASIAARLIGCELAVNG